MPDRTLSQAGGILGLSPSTLRHQAQTGRLRARLVGKTYVVSDREIARYRAEHLGKRRLRLANLPAAIADAAAEVELETEAALDLPADQSVELDTRAR